MKVFLLAGQSNMQGCGNFGIHPRLNNDRLFNFRDDEWQKAEEPLHNYTCKIWPDGGSGLAMSFGIHLLRKHPDWRIGFAPCAMSGSSLEQWLPGTDLFENTVSKTRQALAACNSELTGILWHQGEADSKSMETATAYAVCFKKVIEAFRKEFNNEKLPVIAGELGYFLAQNPQFPSYRIVNKALKETATAFVSADGLTDNDRNDNTHFDTKSLRKLGIRYAESYINLHRLRNHE
jgi:hypothetical protein